MRILAATNADLPQMATVGAFRADLLDRLAFDVVLVPPLRERKEDIVELAESFAIRFISELGWEYFPGFSHEAIETLNQHDWPGNIRELRNVVERSVFRWNQPEEAVEKIIINPFKKQAPEGPDEDIPKTNPMSHQEQTEIPLVTIPTSPTPNRVDLKAMTNQLQQQLILSALSRHKHNQRAAAQSLQLTYNQFRGLYRKLFQNK